MRSAVGRVKLTTCVLLGILVAALALAVIAVVVTMNSLESQENQIERLKTEIENNQNTLDKLFKQLDELVDLDYLNNATSGSDKVKDEPEPVVNGGEEGDIGGFENLTGEPEVL